jgi:hypothetical protein
VYSIQVTVRGMSTSPTKSAINSDPPANCRNEEPHSQPRRTVERVHLGLAVTSGKRGTMGAVPSHLPVYRHGNVALTQSRRSSDCFDAHDSGAGMKGRTSLQAVSPAGLVIDTVTLEADQLLVIAHSGAPDAACTACGERSSQIHSRYQRRLLDLPSHGRSVRLHVQVPLRQCRMRPKDFR